MTSRSSSFYKFDSVKSLYNVFSIFLSFAAFSVDAASLCYYDYVDDLALVKGGKHNCQHSQPLSACFDYLQ